MALIPTAPQVAQMVLQAMEDRAPLMFKDPARACGATRREEFQNGPREPMKQRVLKRPLSGAMRYDCSWPNAPIDELRLNSCCPSLPDLHGNSSRVCNAATADVEIGMACVSDGP